MVKVHGEMEVTSAGTAVKLVYMYGGSTQSFIRVTSRGGRRNSRTLLGHTHQYPLEAALCSPLLC